MTRIVDKGWGREVIYADEPEYCGKLLIFDKIGSKGSMHFHKQKKESWYVLQGTFDYNVIDTSTGLVKTYQIKRGDVVINLPFTIHQLQALEDNSIILEVSTKDELEDNFRVYAGDSQMNQENI